MKRREQAPAKTSIIMLRRQCGLTQQTFAEILGLPSASIYRWENGLHEIRSYGRVVLDLLDCALANHSPAIIVARLRRCDGDQTDILRTLAFLDIRRCTAFKKEVDDV